MKMVRTLKLEVFKKLIIGNREEPAVKEINGRVIINPAWCDPRPAPKRMNAETKKVAPSNIENILIAESVLSSHYATEINGCPCLYDFITLDYSGGNDRDPATKRIKDKTCFDGLYIPLSALEAIGYTPHSEVDYTEINSVKYVKYKLVIQSASENRQCKVRTRRLKSLRSYLMLHSTP
jgi:hypothetical protein